MNRVQSVSRELAARRFSMPMPAAATGSAASYSRGLWSVHHDLRVNERTGIPNPVDPIKPNPLAAVELENAMVNNLWAKLPIAGRLTWGKDHLVGAYARSMEMLATAATEMSNFTDKLLESRIVTPAADTPFLQEAKAALHQHLRLKLNDNPRLPPSLITADFVTEPANVMLERMRADIGEKTRHLCSRFVSLLREGALESCIGVATWLDESTCRFTYGTARVIYVGRTVRGTQQTSRTVTTWSDHQFQHRMGFCEHHLMNATLAPGIPPKSFVPPKLHAVLDSIPQIVRPFIATIDGKLIRERLVEWDVFSSTYAGEEVVRLPERLPEWDPALVFGPFVLVGWTNRDFPGAGGLVDAVRGFGRWAFRPTSVVRHRE
jgi:hypothetical protein